MTTHEQLGYAAKAMGWESWDFLPRGGRLNVYDAEGRCALFAPHLDQADSDRMACKLRIDSYFGVTYVVCMKKAGGDKAIIRLVEHNNTDEDVCRAVLEARMQVAAEIGRAM